ncbi:MAG: hypothetical protein KDD38_08980 [Bdellovibrionales bacterium]|nr:hypothetical protein [Bdellovibrionales bacterium]
MLKRGEEPFFIILNYLTAFLLISVALSIWLHPIRTSFHKSLCFLFVLAGAIQWLLAFALERESGYLLQLVTIGYLLFTVCAAFVYIKFNFFKRADLHGKDLPILKFVLLMPFLSALFAVTNIFYANHVLLTNYTPYSGFFAMTLVHMISRCYFAPGPKVIRREIIFIARCIVFGAFCSGVMFLSGVIIISGLQFYLALGVVYACSLLFTSTYTQLTAMIDRESTHFLTILSELDKSSLSAFIRDLSRAGILKNVKVASPVQIQELDCGDVYALLTEGAVYTLSFVEECLKEIKTNRTNVSALLAIRSLLTHYNVQAITRIGDTRFLLMASQEALTSPLVFHSVLVHVSVLMERFITHGYVVPEGLELKSISDGAVASKSAESRNVVPFKDQKSFLD